MNVPAGTQRRLIGWKIAPEPVDSGVPESVARILSSALVRCSRVTFAEGRELSFVHTMDANEAQRLFDSDYFHWSMGAQAAFLSSPSASVPGISKAHMNAAFDGAKFARIADAGVTGLFLPGVDGDVAGLYTFEDSLMMEIVHQLQSICENAGVGWQEVDEDEFTQLVCPSS